MKFERKWLEDEIYSFGGDVKTVTVSVREQGRLNNTFEVVFKVLETGKYYSVKFSRGCTEYTDEGPKFFNVDAAGMVECPEVWQVPVVTMKWVTEEPIQGSCEGKTYLPIEVKEYTSLHKDSIVLGKLFAAGVDNWVGYEDAMDD